MENKTNDYSKFNKFEVFNNENLGSVRTILDLATNEIWFVGKDVCDCLEIANSRDSISKLLPDEKMTVGLTDSHSGKRGGAQKITVVSESGMYTLVMRSRKKAAVEFQRWITREVLPSIRKNGGYIKGQEELPEAVRQELEENIQAKYEHIQEKLAIRTTKWHKAVQERDALKTQVSAYKKTVRGLKFLAERSRKEAEECRKEAAASNKAAKAWKKDSDETFSLNLRMIEEVAELEKELSELKKLLSLYRGPEQKFVTVVDRQGFLA